MAGLAQISQFWNEPGRSYVEALADPPQGVLDGLEWSKEQAQDVGDVDPDNGHTWEFRHTDPYKDQQDSRAMSHEQFA